MNEKKIISDYVGYKISLLDADSPWSKAELAKLRRCVGKDIRESQDTWEIILDGIPEELMGRPADGFEPSAAECAVHTTLTLYALHMQGRTRTANSEERSFASAIAATIDGTNDEGVRRRFASMITATDLNEMTYHARSLIQIMRTKENICFDYRSFAKDLYSYQFPEGKRNVLIRWGRDFYTSPAKDKNKEE